MRRSTQRAAGPLAALGSLSSAVVCNAAQPTHTVLQRRQSTNSPGGPRNDDDSAPVFSYPFVTLAVVAVAVFVLIVILVIVRMMVWNRRARQQAQNPNMDEEDGVYPPAFAPAPPPPDPIKPPPILEKVISPLSAPSRAHVPHVRGDWNMLQPVSVCFDRPASDHLRSTIRELARARELATQESLATQAQVTCLISLPTARTTFPDRLRRRPKEARSSLFTPLFNGGDGRPSYESELTGDLSHGHSLKRAASVHSRASAKEMSDARRDAYFEHLERDAKPDVGGLAPPQPELSRRNSRVSMRSAADEGDVDHVGIFAFGSAVFPITKAPGRDAEKHAPPTKADLSSLFERAQRVEAPTKR